MKIADLLLPKLVEWTPSSDGERHTWSQPLDGSDWSLYLAADKVDTLGCLLWEIALTRPNAGPLDNAELKKHAMAVADRATGMMEPLRFIELDETRGEAQLRSESPAKRAKALAYYEVLLTGGRQIQVRRYQHPTEGTRREQVAFALTHEAIAKLVDDLVRE